MKVESAGAQRIEDFFRKISLVNDLQMVPEEREWLAEPPPSPKPAQVLLYLGCNLLRTPSLIKVVCGLLRKLHLDFVTVGGPTYC
ncbi:MAG: hypothetical protein HYX99_03790, partial [Chloroflexi bacterium]|nr:hypothetical protein [Chloroflexota bacterium]